MKKLLKLKELKKLFLLLPILLLISCAVKVKTVNDSFYGTQHYETDYMTITGWDTTIKLRFSKLVNTDNVILDALYVSSAAFTISKGNKIILKFSDNSFINLNYTSEISKIDKGEMLSTYKWLLYDADSFDTYTINANARVDNIGNLVAIRIENSAGFKNIEVKSDFSKKFKNAFEEIKNK